MIDVIILTSSSQGSASVQLAELVKSKKIKVIDCTFDISLSLKVRIEAIREETETAVREGSTTLILSDKNITNFPTFHQLLCQRAKI